MLFLGKKNFLFLLSNNKKNVVEISSGYSSPPRNSWKGIGAVRTTILLVVILSISKVLKSRLVDAITFTLNIKSYETSSFIFGELS